MGAEAFRDDVRRARASATGRRQNSTASSQREQTAIAR
jgi:hypothetical protein